MTFRSLRRSAIEAQLAASGQHLLAGQPLRPQALTPIRDTAIDFGVAEYSESTMGEIQNISQSESYHYVLKGMIEYQDLDSRAIHRFKAGDFYVLSPDSRFVSRVKQDTRIVFAVNPSGASSQVEILDAQAFAWAEERLLADRVDYAGDEAPAANSMIPGASAAVIDDRGQLLLVRRRDSGNWTMPGGAMEIGDSLASCVRREVAEETSIAVEVLGIIGTYSDPGTVVAYSDGEVRREFTILFHCKPVGGALTINDESTDGRWVSLDAVPDLPMAASQHRRIDDVIRFIGHGTVSIR